MLARFAGLQQQSKVHDRPELLGDGFLWPVRLLYHGNGLGGGLLSHRHVEFNSRSTNQVIEVGWATTHENNKKTPRRSSAFPGITAHG